MNKGLGKRMDKRLRERERVREKERSSLAPWRTEKIAKSTWGVQTLRIETTVYKGTRALRENEANYIEP